MASKIIFVLGLVIVLFGAFGCAAQEWQYKYPDPQKFDGFEWYATPGFGSATVEPSTSH